MKKFLKIMLCIMGSLLAVIVAFWFSISYLILIRLSTCEVRCFLCESTVLFLAVVQIYCIAIGVQFWHKTRVDTI